MSKSPEAFRTISEVSAELDVPKHVLRFWETKFAQVKPMKRGGNRRYYRPEDVELLRGIRTLLHDEGYTIRGLQRVMRQQGVNYVKTCWRNEMPDGVTQAQSALPDLAGEAAGHARNEALARAKAQPKRRNRAASAGTQAASDTKETTLGPAQRAELETLLNELQQCRELLAGAGAEPSAA